MCALTDVDGEILAMAPVDGTIASATVSPDDRTWMLAPGGEPGAQVLRWKPPEPPRTEAWELPLPGSAQRIVGISEVAWHPADAQRLEEIERQAIIQALRKHDFNRTETAKALGISRRALIYKLQRFRALGDAVDPVRPPA